MNRAMWMVCLLVGACEGPSVGHGVPADGGLPSDAKEGNEGVPCDEWHQTVTTGTTVQEQWRWTASVDASGFDPSTDRWPRAVLCDWEQLGDTTPPPSCPVGSTCAEEGIPPPTVVKDGGCDSFLPELIAGSFVFNCGSRSKTVTPNYSYDGGGRAQTVYLIR